ncbi:MAG TPA: helix-turn-helix transcriptional regulator [Candidatus Sulfotelmatobacter sp.]|nr:helix-turn-helix transcriptional regulator [Candidatus Sulfotelmatobacter sp.]
MHPPGLRLRQTREALGLTYRDVERASYQIAVNRGRSDFILHISRLADIENRGVVPSLHKLYSLAAILHLDPLEISNWYEAPFRQTFHDGAAFPPPSTHLAPSPLPAVFCHPLDHPLGSEDTELLARRPATVVPMPHGEHSPNKHRYGYIGLTDRRMMPLLRPGSMVLIDTTLRRIEDAEWSSEYDRPMYFVEIRKGYRCGWFQKDKSRLIMQPHTLSRCAPESWLIPDEAEVVGQVVGVVSYLGDPWTYRPAAIPEARSDWNSKAL